MIGYTAHSSGYNSAQGMLSLDSWCYCESGACSSAPRFHPNYAMETVPIARVYTIV